MYINDKILMAKAGDNEYYILPKMANRHGIIAGATGSGKTITLKVMAESFSDAGVPVFLADVKGDLAGMCVEGIDTDDMKKRIEKFNIASDFKYKKYPTEFFDINRVKGLPVRTTITEFGPILLSYILGLNDIQTDLMNVLFKIADDANMFIYDIKDLKAMLNFMSEHSAELADKYGSIAKASVTAIMRAIVSLEQEGIDQFFGEPALMISDFLRVNENGQGFINILHSESLIHNRRVYSAFMLWLLSELFENMPEVGDLDKPKMVFFFDEAHLLFADANTALLKKIDQVTKLIRSKGIGLYFITQDPTDIPDTILQQLGNKIQHVHRAYTAKEKQNLKAIVSSFRENENLNLIDVVQNLGTGEAIVSFLDEKGVPSIVESVKILPPQSKMGIIDDSMRENVIKSSLLYYKYYNDIDSESAYEILMDEDKKYEREKSLGIDKEAALIKKAELEVRKKQEKELIKQMTGSGKEVESAMTKNMKSIMKTISGSVGREAGKAVSSTLFGKKNSPLKTIFGNSGSAIARGLFGTLISKK